ncbi:MAG: thioesterase family protein [Actinomycetota bacterium]|nr:thioesterase family protein [Actinomycetota bacterium]
MNELDAILASLQLEQIDEHHFRAGNVPVAHGVIFGGQLMGQAIVAAARGQEAKLVKTLHIVFARGGSTDQPVDIEVDPIAVGRSVGSCTVSFRQGGRLFTRAVLLLTADEPDLIRFTEGGPGPSLSPPREEEGTGWQVHIEGDVDINDPDAVGPAELDVWTRFVGAPDDPLISQALLSYATDGFLIATAMRPHKGIGQAQSHQTLSTAVLGHTITFHEPFSASEWMLLAHRSPYAGRGRTYGRADVFRADGTFVASFTQDNMIRSRPESATGVL